MLPLGEGNLLTDRNGQYQFDGRDGRVTGWCLATTVLNRFVGALATAPVHTQLLWPFQICMHSALRHYTGKAEHLFHQRDRLTITSYFARLQESAATTC